MKRTDFGELLEELNLPYVFWQFDNEEETIPELPYLVYYDIDPFIFYADNKPYYCASKFAVELYTEEKADDLQAKLEGFFNSHNFSFIHEPRFIPEEDLFQEYYEVQT